MCNSSSAYLHFFVITNRRPNYIQACYFWFVCWISLAPHGSHPELSLAGGPLSLSHPFAVAPPVSVARVPAGLALELIWLMRFQNVHFPGAPQFFPVAQWGPTDSSHYGTTEAEPYLLNSVHLFRNKWVVSALRSPKEEAENWDE